MMSVCAYCRHWKFGTTDKEARTAALEDARYCECHVKQPQDTRADDTCNMWTEVGA